MFANISVQFIDPSKPKLSTDEGYSSRSPTIEAMESDETAHYSKSLDTHARPLPQAKSTLFTRYKHKHSHRKHSIKNTIILKHNLRFIQPSSSPLLTVRHESHSDLPSVDVLSSSTTQDRAVPSWTVYDPYGEHASSDGMMDLGAAPLKEEVDELEQDDIPVGEDTQASSCMPTCPVSKHPTVALLNLPSNGPSTTPHFRPNTPTPPPHPHIPTSPPTSHSSPPSSPHPADSASPPPFNAPGTGVSNIPGQPHPHAVGTVGTAHKAYKSKVIKLLTGNLTSAGNRASEWADAINQYLQLHSTASADPREAKKALLRTKWALGEMYEARDDVRRIVLKKAGVTRALTLLVASRDPAVQDRDIQALWEKAEQLAAHFRKRFRVEYAA